jgi:alkylation response protein AidB-like acyl-CoA dehydrogenase
MPAALKERRPVQGGDKIIKTDEMLAHEMIERARTLVPVLAAREAEAIAGREIPSTTMDDFRSSGLMRILQPKRFGGLEGSVALFSRIAQELANGCASSAWVYTVFGEHAWIVAGMPEQAQVDVWGNNPDAVASSSLAPRSVASLVEGGFRLSGRFPFSSGCGHAQWAILGAFSSESGRDQRYMLVPMSEVRIIDDWEVIGLRATGSKTLELDDVFIPEHRTVLVSELIKGTPPGATVHPDYPLLTAPRYYQCVYSQMSVAITLGRRAVDDVAATLRDRFSGGDRKVAGSDMVQIKFAQSAAEVDAANLIFDTGRQASSDAVAQRRTISAEEIAARHRDVAFVHQLVRTAVERLCDIMGTSWVYDRSRLQSYLRDILTMSTHGVVNPQLAIAPYGRLRLCGPA